MAARPFDAPLGAAGADTKRWRSLALIALANVLLWTTVLGWMLLPRGSESPVVSSPRALNAADSTVAHAPGSGGAPATARPKAYSSIDTQTLAAARAREDVLAGKRAPPEEEDKAQPVAAPSTAMAQPGPVPARARRRSISSPMIRQSVAGWS